MKCFKKYAIITSVGGVYYYLLEILWRGYSYAVMIPIGGLCVLLLYVLNDKLENIRFVPRCVIGSIAITATELASGILVNNLMGLNAWDYSDRSFNFMGQISLGSSIMWLTLCIPAFCACSIVKKII